MHDYWKQQPSGTPLYPDIEWGKPEQKSARGKLAIIGGNKQGFAVVAGGYTQALKVGAGEVRLLLPDCLRKSIPNNITDVVYGECTSSGSLSRGSITAMQAIGEWSNAVLLLGDAGRNSETSIVYTDFINKYSGSLVITRDAIDLLKEDFNVLVERQNTVLILSFAQTQKLFQTIYYPIVLTYSMQLTQLVEALHKFTITNPITILTYHNDNIIIAHSGSVVSQKWDNPIDIWQGKVAVNVATYLMWAPSQPLESLATGILFK